MKPTQQLTNEHLALFLMDQLPVQQHQEVERALKNDTDAQLRLQQLKELDANLEEFGQYNRIHDSFAKRLVYSILCGNFPMKF